MNLQQTEFIDVFRNELDSSERILCAGQPKQGLMFHIYDIFLIPFSLIWGGGVITVFFSAIFQEGPVSFFSLIFLPFLLVGIYVILGRFFVDAYIRRKTYYALTNDRIIIFSGIFSQTIKSLSLKTLPEITMKQNRDSRGTITFGPSHPFANMYGGMWPGFGQNSIPQFEAIENVKAVYNQIRQAQKATISNT